MIGGAGECFGAQIEAQWHGALVLRQARALSEQKTAEYYRGLIRIRIGFGGPLHYNSQKEPPKIVLGNYLGLRASSHAPKWMFSRLSNHGVENPCAQKSFV